jgi:hypothetical protein
VFTRQFSVSNFAVKSNFNHQVFIFEISRVKHTDPKRLKGGFAHSISETNFTVHCDFNYKFFHN